MADPTLNLSEVYLLQHLTPSLNRYFYKFQIKLSHVSYLQRLLDLKLVTQIRVNGNREDKNWVATVNGAELARKIARTTNCVSVS